jgi:acid phosphatase (class A)
VLKFPAAADVFSCTLGATISEKQTPHLYTLLRRSYVDAGLATYTAKDRYARVRPFLISKLPTCTPAEEASLAKDGAYPSGHAALGWAWGLLLAEMAPEKAQAVLERANAFGQSRQICGVHWLSDIAAGQVVGSAAVARLHADPVFKAQFTLAQAELQASMGRGTNEGLDCTAESAALAVQP